MARTPPVVRARTSVGRWCVLVVAVLLGGAVATVPAGGVAAADDDRPTRQPARYVPVEPCRVLDTRREPGHRLGAGSSTPVDVAGRCGVADDATVAALTVTAVGTTGRGYVTLFAAGAARPVASALNFDRGETIANLQLVELGDDGAVAAFVRTATHLVVDVTGYFVPADDGVARSGRFVPVAPHRIADTRTTRRPSPRSSVRIRPDVPADATAVAVTVATTDTRGPGYFTAHAAGTPRPVASTLNVDRAGQTRGATAIVPHSPDGLEVYTHGGDHVIVDITGYFTGDDAAMSGDGLFVASDPTRLVDTRARRSSTGGPRLWDRGAREFDATPITGGPVAALAANVVAIETEDRGFLTAYPARTARPTVATLNYDHARSTIANTGLLAVSDRGLAVYARESTDLVVDVTGWFTGRPAAGTEEAAVNAPPDDRRVTIIGDSAAAGIRWNGALDGLRGFRVDARLESCRRLVMSSCRGREGYAPRTVASEIDTLPPAGPEDLLVIATGYNDFHTRFAADFDVVVARARAKGFHHVMWVDYRTAVRYHVPSTGIRSDYAEMNRILAAKIDSGDYPEVRRWELDAYTRSAPEWFASDGIHHTPLGSWGVADWISRHVRAFDDRPCAMPWVPGGSVETPCPDPDRLSATRGLPDIIGLYGR